MTKILAIDPGNTESAYVLIDATDCLPITFKKVPNDQLLQALHDALQPGTRVAIEMIASYGMAVGAEVFETCVWIGRYQEAALNTHDVDVELVKRLPVKVHHCHSSKAKDSNIIQALVDRFAYGQPNRGKGTKADPGWFYGFAADVWQAYALAIYVADQQPATNPVPAPDGVVTPGAGTATRQEALL